MDPITLATVTSALVVLATESAKGIASSAGEDLWVRIKSVLGWQTEPKDSELAQSIASRLEKDGALVAQIVDLLKGVPAGDSAAGTLVGNIDADKVVVAGRFQVAGDFKM